MAAPLNSPGMPLVGSTATSPAVRTVTLLGDSLTAGYGLSPQDALPRRLADELADAEPPVHVIDAGISGDTLRDGLNRWRRDVPADTALCVIALGANDMMQQRKIQDIGRDLSDLVDQVRHAGMSILLCGMRAPPWFGAYALQFDALFPEIARTRNIPMMPFLLEDVALDPRYVLGDRIHPNAQGVGLMARKLAPFVRTALDAVPSTADGA